MRENLRVFIVLGQYRRSNLQQRRAVAPHRQPEKPQPKRKRGCGHHRIGIARIGALVAPVLTPVRAIGIEAIRRLPGFR